MFSEHSIHHIWDVPYRPRTRSSRDRAHTCDLRVNSFAIDDAIFPANRQLARQEPYRDIRVKTPSLISKTPIRLEYDWQTAVC